VFLTSTATVFATTVSTQNWHSHSHPRAPISTSPSGRLA
jgi:hypothetical protein